MQRLLTSCVNVGVQLMRELEKVVRPNVVHFSFIDATTSLGQLRYVLSLIMMMIIVMTAVAWRLQALLTETIRQATGPATPCISIHCQIAKRLYCYHLSCYFTISILILVISGLYISEFCFVCCSHARRGL